MAAYIVWALYGVLRASKQSALAANEFLGRSDGLNFENGVCTAVRGYTETHTSTSTTVGSHQYGTYHSTPSVSTSVSTSSNAINEIFFYANGIERRLNISVTDFPIREGHKIATVDDGVEYLAVRNLSMDKICVFLPEKFVAKILKLPRRRYLMHGLFWASFVYVIITSTPFLSQFTDRDVMALFLFLLHGLISYIFLCAWLHWVQYAQSKQIAVEIKSRLLKWSQEREPQVPAA